MPKKLKPKRKKTIDHKPTTYKQKPFYQASVKNSLPLFTMFNAYLEGKYDPLKDNNELAHYTYQGWLKELFEPESEEEEISMKFLDWYNEQIKKGLKVFAYFKRGNILYPLARKTPMPSG